MCNECVNNGTEYCVICDDNEFFMSAEEKEYYEWMCNLMCGGVE